MENVEIERKFLVEAEGWRDGVRVSRRLVQGYLSVRPEATVRVRIRGEQEAVLTIKGEPEELVRPEFEYSVPVSDARQMLDGMCVGEPVQKVRHEVMVGDHLWVVDEFEGANEGLVVAEVELQRADETFEMPQWAGEEVTGCVRYYNARLAETPYRQWEK